MSNHRSKQLNAQIESITRSSPVRPSRNGYWPCPLCGTINRAVVTVIPNAGDEPTEYAVSERLTCRGQACGHTFEALAPARTGGSAAVQYILLVLTPYPDCLVTAGAFGDFPALIGK